MIFVGVVRVSIMSRSLFLLAQFGSLGTLSGYGDRRQSPVLFGQSRSSGRWLDTPQSAPERRGCPPVPETGRIVAHRAAQRSRIEPCWTYSQRPRHEDPGRAVACRSGDAGKITRLTVGTSEPGSAQAGLGHFHTDRKNRAQYTHGVHPATTGTLDSENFNTCFV